jgi:antitoxin Phd
MAQRWQLQEAKNKLSEVVDQAINDGPQIITRRGADAAVVLSYATFRTLTLRQQPLSKFFSTSPLAAVELDLARDQTLLREDIAL